MYLTVNHYNAGQILCSTSETAPAGKWLSCHDALFEVQPVEDTPGCATKDLVSRGEDAGVVGQGVERRVTGQDKKA
ncbi:hypothetical protein AB0395_36470 [Streptosporangium sp. NPDC051023]|uniref:hypothetical protein n=1 Tax=Streptosporangium sp. NPDC051023 TaxID=3155410 RepID=UPI00344E94A0